MTHKATKRFLLMEGPRGYLTCLPADDSRLIDRYWGWTVLIKVNRPLSPPLAEAAKDWAVKTFQC